MADGDFTRVKRCTACKGEFSATPEHFYKNRSKWDGLATECKACLRALVTARFKADPEKHREKMRENYRAKSDEYKARARQWEQANPKRKKELQAKFRAANKEKIAEQSRVDWQRHNEKRLEKKREYRAANPEKGAELYKKYQTKKAHAFPVWADREKILAFYAEAKRLTQETGVKHHVDHYYPLRSSTVCGLHNEFNLQVLTAFENQSKGNKVP